MKIVTKKGYEEYSKMLSLRDELIIDFKKYINGIAICLEEVYDLMEHDIADCELADNDEICDIDEFWNVYQIYNRVMFDEIYTIGEEIEFDYDLHSEEEMNNQDCETLKYLAARFVKYFETVILKFNKHTSKIINLKDTICEAIGVDENNVEEFDCGWNEDESLNCALEAIRIAKNAIDNKNKFTEMVLHNENFWHLESIKKGEKRTIDIKSKR